MSERVYYVICADDCRFEGMSKEQIFAAIAEATGNTPTDVDAAFITKIKETNKNNALSFWYGTEAEFNALGVSATKMYIRVSADNKIYICPKSSEDPIDLVEGVHYFNSVDELPEPGNKGRLYFVKVT